MIKMTVFLRICRRQFLRVSFAAIPVLLASLAVLAAGEGGNRPKPAAAGQDAVAEPDTAVVPFLGTWLLEETFVQHRPPLTYSIHRYLLIRWDKNRMRVKTLDYLPELRTRSHISDWNGIIPIDRWSQWKQTFVIMPDGTISLGLSGTDGFGPASTTSTWWASGRLVLLEDDEAGPRLHYYTDRGYSPTSKGNAWQPLDRIYHLVSREIDPKYLLSRKY